MLGNSPLGSVMDLKFFFFFLDPDPTLALISNLISYQACFYIFNLDPDTDPDPNMQTIRNRPDPNPQPCSQGRWMKKKEEKREKI